MSEKKQNNAGLLILLIAVFIVFLVFKLAQIGMIANWSWWAVTAPLWAPIVLILGIQIVSLIIMVLFSNKD